MALLVYQGEPTPKKEDRSGFATDCSLLYRAQDDRSSPKQTQKER